MKIRVSESQLFFPEQRINKLLMSILLQFEKLTSYSGVILPVAILSRLILRFLSTCSVFQFDLNFWLSILSFAIGKKLSGTFISPPTHQRPLGSGYSVHS